MARMVTLRSFLICSSISREPFQCARAKPPWISGFRSENALTRLGGIIERNGPYGDLEVVLDLFFDFARAIPVRESETAVDFRFCRIFRRKEIIEVLLAIDLARVGVTEFSCPLKEVLLNRVQNFRRRSDEFLDRHGLFGFDRLIAAA